MFNNFINRHDFIDFFCDMRKVTSSLYDRMSFDSEKRTKASWGKTTRPPTNWWNIPQVHNRWNEMISGDKNINYYQYINENFLTESNLKGLSFGCGTGTKEIQWAKSLKFDSFDAFDLSKERISLAQKNSEKELLHHILNFREGNVFEISAPENHYDIAFGDNSLHHFSPLQDIIIKIKKSLKPGGLLIINEYVSPNKFQWTDRQLMVANNLLEILPRKYKKLWGSNKIKAKVIRQSLLRMSISDPSEAVESSNIIPIISKNFEPIVIKGYGGTILHPLFNKISHNFLSNDNETEYWLNICFKIEDILLYSNEIQHDFVVGVFKKNY